jgi:hypothetical protein
MVIVSAEWIFDGQKRTGKFEGWGIYVIEVVNNLRR